MKALARLGAGLGTFAALDAPGRLLFAAAWMDLTAAWLRVRFGGPGEAILEAWREEDGESREAPAAEPSGLGVFERAARTHPLAPTCLPRALALVRFLRRQGAPGRLQIGLRRSGAGLHGHAWVEVRGSPVNDGSEALRRFVPLKRGLE